MNKFLTFVKSPLGIGLIVAILLIALILIIYFWYQKKYVWNNIGKSGVISAIALVFKNKFIASVKLNDVNYLANPTDDNLKGILKWYVDNANFGEFDVDALKTELNILGVDFVKHPSTLSILNSVITEMKNILVV